MKTRHEIERFVKTWKASTSVREVAQEMSMSLGAVRVLASRLRVRGVALEHMRHQHWKRKKKTAR